MNVHDYREVTWKALNHIDPERDIEFVMGPIDILDHSSRLAGYGSHNGARSTFLLVPVGVPEPSLGGIALSVFVAASRRRPAR